VVLTAATVPPLARARDEVAGEILEQLGEREARRLETLLRSVCERHGGPR